MEQEKDVQEVQETPEAVEETPVKEVIIKDEEPVKEPEVDVDDLQKKADASSQNFERAKKAENEVKELREQLESNQVLSEYEEGDTLKEDVSELKQKLEAADIKEAYPELKDSWSDFDTFRQEDDNKAMPMRTAAKAFMAEKGLLEPRRKGLETPTGGKGEAYSSSMSTEQLQELRINDGRKYQEMIEKGQVKFDS